jgi:hypothetical protein
MKEKWVCEFSVAMKVSLATIICAEILPGQGAHIGKCKKECYSILTQVQCAQLLQLQFASAYASDACKKKLSPFHLKAAEFLQVENPSPLFENEMVGVGDKTFL